MGMNQARRRGVVVAALVLSACGQVAGEGSASLAGQGAFVPEAAISTSAAGFGVANVGFYLTDFPATCVDARQRGKVPFEGSIVIGAVVSSTGVTSGAYPIGDAGVRSEPDGGVAIVGAFVTVRSSGGEDEAVGGEVSLTRADTAGIGGTFTARFQDGGVLTGTFDAPSCPGLL